MKNSILVIILLVGVALLGYILINKQNRIENQTQNQDNSLLEEDPQMTPTQNNNQGSNVNTTQAQSVITKASSELNVSNNKTNKEEALGISIDLPAGAKLKAVPSSPSSYDGATVVDMIFVLLTSDSIVPVIEKFLSNVVVVSHNELDPKVNIRSMGTIKV